MDTKNQSTNKKENNPVNNNKKRKDNNPSKDYADMIFERERQFCHQVISEMHSKIAVLSYLKKQINDQKRLETRVDDFKDFDKVFDRASNQIIDIKQDAWPHLKEQILTQKEDVLKEAKDGGMPRADEALKNIQKAKEATAEARH